ncbi:threonine/homoserine/homoserine lactone efflux protein [Staphylococcus pasteuri]|uniref:LysE family translocator n=1 Tax=Staphylococcus pasteuri_A TaxID=3062664 RepID=A0AAW7YN31_9STAP|nr:LysE family translocator [Staphylococcus pasteuri_A]MDO6572939.1 LysE family translocator [Staphylococcus pasteuri_A]
MFDIISFQVFLLTAIIICVTPGIDTMFILSRSISQGRSAGVFSVLGVSSGSLIHTVLAAVGLSALLKTSVLLFTVVKTIGAIYLIYLGIQMLINKGTRLDIVEVSEISNRKLFTQGMITNVTNPKVALFYISFVPQFISSTNHYGPIPFIILGVIFTLIGTIWDLITVIFSSALTSKLRNNKLVEPILNKITGIIFIILGISLFNTKAH